ncbi:MAG TPA: enoyl-CoA hydratase, partial [Alphaproteobacteria bacterium]|nr:enoyl-CoA hydratase [Alphaproteobacteria bacterium]
MAYKMIQVKTEGRVGVITLDRAEALNALCDTLTTELAEALAAFEADSD